MRSNLRDKDEKPGYGIYEITEDSILVYNTTMKTNYHTHTTRCMHAVGSDEEYVLSAIKGGFQILGFSDHTPWKYRTSYIADMRMLPEELPATTYKPADITVTLAHELAGYQILFSDSSSSGL